MKTLPLPKEDTSRKSEEELQNEIARLKAEVEDKLQIWREAIPQEKRERVLTIIHKLWSSKVPHGEEK